MSVGRHGVDREMSGEQAAKWGRSGRAEVASAEANLYALWEGEAKAACGKTHGWLPGDFWVSRTRTEWSGTGRLRRRTLHAGWA